MKTSLFFWKCGDLFWYWFYDSSVSIKLSHFWIPESFDLSDPTKSTPKIQLFTNQREISSLTHFPLHTYLSSVSRCRISLASYIKFIVAVNWSHLPLPFLYCVKSNYVAHDLWNISTFQANKYVIITVWSGSTQLIYSITQDKLEHLRRRANEKSLTLVRRRSGIRIYLGVASHRCPVLQRTRRRSLSCKYECSLYLHGPVSFL